MKLISTLLFMLAFQAHAAQVKLATITTNTDNDRTVFYIEVTEQGEIHSMRYQTTTDSGQISEDIQFSAEEVLDGGVVLEERRGHEAVRLHLESYSPTAGGIVILNYLVNGITGSRRELKLILKKTETGYGLTDLSGTPINCMYFRGNWIRFAGLVGIRNIESSWNPKEQSREE